MARTKRHKVFISYYHEDDQEWKERFVRMMGDKIVDRSVNIADIVGDSPPAEDTLRRIRENYISDAAVTVVLIGPRTWQRKYVDWEIGATLRDTQTNPRCGVLGILLPTHPNYGETKFDRRLIPPRLADNLEQNDPFAFIQSWPGQRNRRRADDVQNWIHQAFVRRKRQPYPNNALTIFARNRMGDPSKGWQN